MPCRLPGFEDMDWSPDLQEKREAQASKKKDGFSEALEQGRFVRLSLDELAKDDEVPEYIHDIPW
jgi:hypothetical protein